jgi:hypothetical protein
MLKPMRSWTDGSCSVRRVGLRVWCACMGQLYLSTDIALAVCLKLQSACHYRNRFGKCLVFHLAARDLQLGAHAVQGAAQESELGPLGTLMKFLGFSTGLTGRLSKQHIARKP